jgi:hypothetical protein
MNLANPFSTKTRLLFLYEYACWLCGRSDLGLELHHIYGRISNSPYNAAVVCMECHSHMGHSKTEQDNLLKLACVFLARIGYKAVERDIDFLQKTNIKDIFK